METTVFWMLLQKEIQFKSYYVVWKLFSVLLYFSSCSCLNRTMQYGNDIMKCKKNNKTASLNRTMQYGNSKLCCERNTNANKFKSYYVVWKPICFSLSVRIISSCLNRTMQYGNFYIFPQFSSEYRFKSYYVVWKPAIPASIISL